MFNEKSIKKNSSGHETKIPSKSDLSVCGMDPIQRKIEAVEMGESEHPKDKHGKNERSRTNEVVGQ